MSEFRRSIEAMEFEREKLQISIDRMVTKEFPIGCRVEYEHGEYWVGPCVVESVVCSYGRRDGPDIYLRNERTGKQLRRLSVSQVRHLGEAWGGIMDSIRVRKKAGDQS